MSLRSPSSNMTKNKSGDNGEKIRKKDLRCLAYVTGCKGRVFKAFWSKHFPLSILRRDIGKILRYEIKHKTNFTSFQSLRTHMEAMSRGQTSYRHMNYLSDGFALWLGKHWTRFQTLNQGATPESMVHAAQSLWLKQPQLDMQQCTNITRHFKGNIPSQVGHRICEEKGGRRKLLIIIQWFWSTF